MAPSPSQLRRAEKDRKAQKEREEAAMEFAISEEARQEQLVTELGDGDQLLGKARLLAQHFGTPANHPRKKVAQHGKGGR